MDEIDMSLDEIIRNKKLNKRNNDYQIPSGILKKSSKSNYKTKTKQRRYYAVEVLNVNKPITNKIVVSNLHYGVTEWDLESLFDEIGPLRCVTLHYDRSGRSLGTADIVFDNHMDAITALEVYDGVPLDGRTMNIEFGGPSSSKRQQLLKLYVPPVVRGRSYQNRSKSHNRSVRFNLRNPTLKELDDEIDTYVKSRNEIIDLS